MSISALTKDFFFSVFSVCSVVSLAAAETGTVHFAPADDQKEVPPLYRLGPRSFDYTMKWMYNLPGYDIGVYDVRFPSAVESPTPENNTVYAEYYRPEGKGPFPCAIVLDITGGDQAISRVICTHLSRHGVAGLFVQMAYYGPRRPPGSNCAFSAPISSKQPPPSARRSSTCAWPRPGWRRGRRSTPGASASSARASAASWRR